VLVVYVVVVLGGGWLIGQTSSPNVGLSVLATAAVALGFEPVQGRLETWANRVVHAGRRSPYDVLTRLADTTAGSIPSEEIPGRMALVLAEGTGAEWTQVWLVVRDQLSLAATWPPSAAAAATADAWDGASDTPGHRSLPVRHAGEMLGVLRLKERDGEPLSAVEERLFAGLADQAGLVLRGARLRAELAQRVDELTLRADELTASRRRLVDTQDEERRRLERDIHDGAQQHLVALAVNLRLAHNLAQRSPERATMVLKEQSQAAEDTIRTLTELSRGIYPRLLTDAGLGAALEAAAKTSPVPVTVSVEPGRLAAGVEAAAYFCCLEALQNSVKHARAQHVSVHVRTHEGDLLVRVEDDGVGFESATSPSGEGAANMRDRVETVGGRLALTSTPGGGTTVEARIPLRPVPKQRSG
jgi:signal transduction histidine kinase